MRVAVVCPYSLSAPGGVQGQALGLAGALRRAGHHAVVLAPLDGELAVPGLPADAVIGLGRSIPVPANGSVAPLGLTPASSVRAWRAIARGRFDVVHLHEPLAPGPTWAALARPEPKVGTFHRAGLGRGLRLAAPLARRAASRLSARCAVSEEARATARALAGGDYDIIGNGVELARFTDAVPWPAPGPTVLFVGRHEHRKGLAVLLEAFARVGPALGAHLWVSGQGPDTAALRSRFRSVANVEWLGRVDDDTLAARLAGASVLCAPSLGGESFGIVLVEAMAARTAVVASDIPGYRAVVGDSATLVAPGDAAALAAALTTALSDAAAGTGGSAPRALDAAAARAARWSMDAIAAQYVGEYERVLAEHRGRPPRGS
ncbi:MAG: glycosyltransferase family 4 protein [Acidimicrobiales bacterium]